MLDVDGNLSWPERASRCEHIDGQPLLGAERW